MPKLSINIKPYQVGSILKSMRLNSIFIITYISIWITYITLLISIYPQYLNIKNNPLSMINLLFPIFNIILITSNLLSIGIIYYKINRKYIHIALIIQFSIMIWATPLYISGFAGGPDTLYHMGVSSHLPEVLKGNYYMFADYLENYPASFTYIYIFSQFTNFNFSTFIILYPTIMSIMYVILWYVFIYNNFNPMVAFISSLIAIVGVHVIEIHPSPNTLGIALTLSTLVLLYRKDHKSHIISYITTIMTIIAHPESPLLLLIFVFIPYILLKHESTYTHFKHHIYVIFIGWFTWALFLAVRWGGQHMVEAILRVINLQFIASLFAVSTPSSFIYPVYPQIMMVILLSYGGIACLFIDFKKYIKILLYRSWREITKQMLMLIYFFVYILIMYLFGLLAVLDLRQRALFYAIFTISTFIGVGIQKDIALKKITKWNKCMKLILTIWFILITFFYPIASYCSEVSTTRPPSEGIGMYFLGSNFQLNGKKVYAYRPNQLTLVLKEGTNFQILYLSYYKDKIPSNLHDYVRNSIDVALFQRSIYYEIAMTYDSSFEDNSYTRAYNEIMETIFNRVYSNPTISIFIYSPDA